MLIRILKSRLKLKKIVVSERATRWCWCCCLTLGSRERIDRKGRNCLCWIQEESVFQATSEAQRNGRKMRGNKDSDFLISLFCSFLDDCLTPRAIGSTFGFQVGVARQSDYAVYIGICEKKRNQSWWAENSVQINWMKPFVVTGCRLCWLMAKVPKPPFFVFLSFFVSSFLPNSDCGCGISSERDCVLACTKTSKGDGQKGQRWTILLSYSAQGEDEERD